MKDAAAEGIALVFPDTSPRGAGIADEDKDWDFGTGKPCHKRVCRSIPPAFLHRRWVLSQRNQSQILETL